MTIRNAGFSKIIPIAASFALLVMLPLMTATPKAGPKADLVQVVNTPAEPVPTAAVGTTLINGNVMATQSGPWMVQLGNTSANPVPVVPSDEPFQTKLALHSGDGSALFVVPQGKRLVIEFVSIAATAVATGAMPSEVTMFFEVQTTVNGVAVNHYMPVAPQVKFPSNGYSTTSKLIGAQELRLYADPGTTVYATTQEAVSGAIQSVSISISGHLINVP